MRRPPLDALPFYAARLDAKGRPAPWSLEDLEDFAAASGDPFGGRLVPDRGLPDLSLQIEACDDPPLWVGATARELEAWSRALETTWTRWGLERDECIAVFDYGSSPLVLLASASYTPHLRRGAAERLGVRVICNDGVATLADRMGEIVERLRPAALVLRRDVLAPFGAVLDTTGVSLADTCRWVAVSETDGVPDAAELARWSERWQLPVHRVLRADAGFVLAGECAACGAFHLDRRLYRCEALGPDAVAVTTRFARTCPASRHRIDGASLATGTCDREPEAARLRCP